MDCPICNKSFKSIKGLMPHIKCHGYTSKTLYDEIKKKENEGICIRCKSPTLYVNYTKGYQKFCSSKCSTATTVKNYWDSGTEDVEQRKNKHREKFKKYQNKLGRTKGSKNKNPYPKTKKVLDKFKNNSPPSWEGKRHSEKTKEKMSTVRSFLIETGEIKIMASYKGRYTPKNPEKYKGDIKNIIYRSLWERKFMKKCDLDDNILEWSSEEVIIKYYDLISKKIRRYFPDFLIKVKESNGEIKRYLIEIKPLKQTIEPEVKKRKTKSYIYEVMEYSKNQAKWKAAKEFCEDRQWIFKIITEKELYG